MDLAVRNTVLPFTEVDEKYFSCVRAEITTILAMKTFLLKIIPFLKIMNILFLESEPLIFCVRLDMFLCVKYSYIKSYFFSN